MQANVITPKAAPPPPPGGYGFAAAPAMAPVRATRQGNTLVVPLGAILPTFCVKCGQPGDGEPINRTYYWHTPWLYLLIFFPGLLIYFVVALVVRKKMAFPIHLCHEHHSRRKMFTLVGSLLLLGCIPLGIFAGTQSGPGIGFTVGLGAFITGYVLLAVGRSDLRPQVIDEHHGVFKGACEPFLSQMPSSY
jgi:hypothetical protein